MKSFLKGSGDMDKLKNQFFEITKAIITGGNDTINHPQLQKMMVEEKFDLVITGFIGNTFFVGIAEHFDCPVILVSLQPPSSFVNVLIGNPVAAAGVPQFFLNKDVLNFFIGRVKNALMYIVEYSISFIVDWKAKQLYE